MTSHPSRADQHDIHPSLTEEQRTLLHEWLPGLTIIQDHSWGTIETTVLEATAPSPAATTTTTAAATSPRYIIKAGGPSDHHMAREIHAYNNWASAWRPGVDAPKPLKSHKTAKLLVTEYLDGTLVQGHPAEQDPETYRQTGALLRRFHDQHREPHPNYELKENRKLLRLLEQPHRIPADHVTHLRDTVPKWPNQPATIVPTHGDWQPRNWLIHEGSIRVIDFGRAALRPNYTDLVRLQFQQFATVPGSEAAFLDGYGRDPREPESWYREQVRQAVATAVWAFGVGDEPFELAGRAHLTRLLASRPGEASIAVVPYI